MRVAVIHDTDNDGYMAAAVIKNKYPQSDFFPARSYDQGRLRELPGLVHGYDAVYMVDLSAPPDIMESLKREAKKGFFWFDHHTSAQEMFGAYLGHQEIGKSACRLVFKWFYPGEHLPDAVGLTDRYDLFVDQGQETFKRLVLPFQCIMERLRSVPLYHKTLTSNGQEILHLIKLGDTLWEEEREDFKKAEKWNREWPRQKPGRPYTFVVTQGMKNPGRAAWLLRQAGYSADFYINQNEREDKFTYSIRSIQPEADCLELIKEYSLRGGGHPQAAGFSSGASLFL